MTLVPQCPEFLILLNQDFVPRALGLIFHATGRFPSDHSSSSHLLILLAFTAACKTLDGLAQKHCNYLQPNYNKFTAHNDALWNASLTILLHNSEYVQCARASPQCVPRCSFKYTSFKQVLLVIGNKEIVNYLK